MIDHTKTSSIILSLPGIRKGLMKNTGYGAQPEPAGIPGVVQLPSTTIYDKLPFYTDDPTGPEMN
jgi:hypothetical protein